MNSRPTLVSDDFVNKTNKKIRENCCFTISDLYVHFKYRSLKHEIVTEKLGYHRLQVCCLLTSGVVFVQDNACT